MKAPAINGHNGAGVGRLPRGSVLDPSGNVIRSAAIDVKNAAVFPSYLGGTTGYANYGANLTKNSLVGWLWHGADADGDIGMSIDVLRQRSRDAFMGVPLACGAVETFTTSVIGEGLIPAPNVDADALGISAEEAAALNKELATKFGWWAADPRECDFEAKHDFAMLQNIAFQSMLLSGDCPVLFPLKPRAGTLFELRIRILEADRIRNPYVYDPTLNIFNGVELDNDGALVAYHISYIHPLAFLRFTFPGSVMIGRTFRVEPFGALTGRRNMVLLIKPERPEQRRGVPILSVCLELLKQLGRYVDATVIGAVVQSYFTAFVTSEFPDPTIFDTLLTEDQKQQILNLNPYNVQLGAGVVNFMRPGHEVKFSAPTQPPATFGDFAIACAKFVGAALGMPFEVLLKQYNASYSASRAALLDFWKRVRKYRAQMVTQMCQPVYEEWLTDAIELGLIENFAGDFEDPLIRRAVLKCNWSGASAGSIDPKKEADAADQRVRAGFSTIEREAAELNGSDWRDNVVQQSQEKTEFEEAGLVYPPYRPIAGAASGISAPPLPQSTTAAPVTGPEQTPAGPAPNTPPTATPPPAPAPAPAGAAP
jgi:lambda family phage portal protein